MNALEKALIARIEATGPISIADYMAECLMHPEHGYYQQQAVFGAEGDFITAPEISQMFGEMVGLWLADRWIKMGRPESLQLIELGPGRGTLMADILRATEPVEDFQDALNVHLVEASSQLRDEQRKRVPTAMWHDSLRTVPEGPALIVANEFFDALPIHQFEKRDGIWLERVVGVADGNLAPMLAQAGPQVSLIPNHLKQSPEGCVLEVCPAALSVIGDMAERFSLTSGAALIIDYGYRKSAPGETLQAVADHAYANPFSNPGQADLTAHVDFEQLARAATEKGLKSYGAANQGIFLMSIGLGARAQHLARSSEPAVQEQILADLTRLTADDQMGSLFKVLALQSYDLPPPPGF